MALLTTQRGRQMMDGTARILAADILFPLTAVLTSAFLTRQLGPGGYGLLALTLTTIVWIESAITSFFSRATIKFVGESVDWKPLASAVIRRSAVVGSVAMVCLWGVAPRVSTLLHEPDLAFYLRLGAIDIPILCAAQAYRSVLIGTSRFHESAVGRAARWMMRFCLVVALVALGLSIAGALAGVIGATAVELMINRWYVGIPLMNRQAGTTLPIQRYAAMLFLSSVCVMGYSGMDLFMLKALGATAGQAGVYSAAQNLSSLPTLFSWSFSALLLATLSRLVGEGEQKRARDIGRDALRVTFWLLPIAGIVAGAAPEIVQILFGPAFASAGPLLVLLIIGAAANVLLIVALTIMTSAGCPGSTVAISAPLVLLAFVGHMLVLPRWGAMGAALVTMSVSLVGACVAAGAVYREWSVYPPPGTIARTMVVALLAGMSAALWPTPGLPVFGKLAGIAVIALIVLWWTGEFRQGEIAGVRSLMFRKAGPAQVLEA